MTALASPPQWEENLSTQLICPDCKEDPPNLIEEYSAGDMVCGDCGMVVGQRIVDMSSEWRTFSNDDQNNDDPSRVGDAPNLLLNGDQLSTEVALGDGKLSKDLRRAQNKTVNDKNNKQLASAYRQIQAYCETMGLPASVTNHSKALYKELIDENNTRNLVKSKSMEVIAAGLIFIACREFNVGRTFREVHNITSVSKKEIGKVFKVMWEWRQKNVSANKGSALPEATAETAASGKKCADLVIRFNSVLGISGTVAWRIEQVAKKVDDLGVLAGRSPLSAAGAVIYFVTGLMNETKNIKAIADTTGVSDSTIRTAYGLLLGVKDQLVEPSWLDGKVKMDNLHAA